MLKPRLIWQMMFDDGVLVRTKRFVPDYVYTRAFLGFEAADEVLLLDITRSGPSEASRRVMAEYADRCFVPATMGGNIHTLDDVKLFFDIGADKVVVGRSALTLCDGVASKWGCQAITVGVDSRTYPDLDLVAMASVLRLRGAGEILLQSVGRDGSLRGYDIDLLKRMAAVVDCPVIIGGGYGGWRHAREAIDAGASGCAMSNIFHLTEAHMRLVKHNLAEEGVPVREEVF